MLSRFQPWGSPGQKIGVCTVVRGPGRDLEHREGKLQRRAL